MQNIIQEKKIKERYIFSCGQHKRLDILIFVIVEEVKYRSEKERDEDEERRWWKERKKEGRKRSVMTTRYGNLISFAQQ